jgi:hypothetical protein
MLGNQFAAQFQIVQNHSHRRSLKLVRYAIVSTGMC